uniref:Uncharacterized protein n=1 Tax=Candidatus Kentrum sp. TC TaxID=2126339 RepID=A0A451A364_9GAMM|nr:MAG: hypothetical protein BECKTC1821D_GA0114238_10478 [Candidatus Kentron sp. TC]VFK60467.1 MAG: hypothetical protein BECKTC1821F_GA0114240_10469 [Candidatus Kentron sp. TC]
MPYQNIDASLPISSPSASRPANSRITRLSEKEYEPSFQCGVAEEKGLTIITMDKDSFTSQRKNTLMIIRCGCHSTMEHRARSIYLPSRMARSSNR